jgi:thiamine pyrophosphokinase
MKITPDVILGDFDTVAPDCLKRFENRKEISIIRLNPMKDETDTEAAVDFAIGQGMKSIDVLGATGSRFDHSYANIFLLKKALEQGVEVTFYTGLSRIYLIRGSREYRKETMYGKYISFLQFDGNALGVTLQGFAYDITDFDFDTRMTYRMGVSNERKDECARITIREGVMLAVESLEDKR